MLMNSDWGGVTRSDEMGLVKYAERFRVSCAAGDDNSGSAVAAWLATQGYIENAQHPDDPSCLLTTVNIQADRDSRRVFSVTVIYKTYEDDRRRRTVNSEKITQRTSTGQMMIYFYQSGSPIGGNGNWGLSTNCHTVDIEVNRIHTASQKATWSALVGKTNSGSVSTPGGVLLSATAKELLFVGAREDMIPNGRFEVVYQFSQDFT